MKTLTVFQGNAFLGGRQVAFELRSQAIQFLSENPNQDVVLDFSNVRGVSHSFSDELLSPLSDFLGHNTLNRVKIRHCVKVVREDLEGVADLHDLYMPSFEEAEKCAA